MISRVAEHCFWMSRYLERAENAARILEVNYTLLLDFHVPTEQQWQPLLIISGLQDAAAKLPAVNANTVQEYMTWDEENPFSIRSSLNMARENGRIIREVISAEMFERLNHYYLWMHSANARAIYDTNRSEFYNQIRRINQLISGISDATMSHGEAWDFFRLGKYLERASQTARILDVKYHMLLTKVEDVGTAIDNAHWTAILMSCSGYEPFHKKPRVGPPLDSGLAVVGFLVFDEQFPRSVRRCLAECRDASARISEDPLASPLNAADKKLAELLAWLDARDLLSVVDAGLHESLTHVVDRVHAIGDAIQSTYFDGNLSLLALQNGTQFQTQSQI